MSYSHGPSEDPMSRIPTWLDAPSRGASPWAGASDVVGNANPRAFSESSPFSNLLNGYPILMGGFFIAFFAFLIYLQSRTDIGENGTLRSISDLFVLFGSATCGVTCWYTAARLRPKRSTSGILAGRAWIGWLFLGGSALSYSIGQAIWTWYDGHYASAQLPFPATYDPFYLLVYPLSWVGVALLIPRGGTAAGRTRLLLDAGIAVASALAITWYFILGPTVESLSGSPIEKIVALAYPLGDLSLCVAAALLLFGPSGAAALNGSLGRLAIGVTWLAVTDSLYGYLQLQGAYHTGLLQDIGWPMSWLFIGWAAWVYPEAVARLTGQRLDPRPSSRLSTTGIALRAITPIVLALLTCAVLLLEVALRNAAPLIQIVLVCAGLILLPVVRQLLTLVDNLILNDRLRQALGQSQQAYQESQQALIATSGRAERYDELRAGIENLQAVHAQIAHGDLSARAQVQGPLAPVAQSLNLLIDRLNRWVQLAQTNQIMEGEAHQLRQILEDLSNGRIVPPPASHSSLPTGGALVAAGSLQRQLDLLFGNLRGRVDLLGRNWNDAMQATQDLRQTVQRGDMAAWPEAQRLRDTLIEVERGLTSSQSLLQDLWRSTNTYLQHEGNRGSQWG